jgi:hypothetical protein
VFAILIILVTGLDSVFFIKNHDPLDTDYYTRLMPGAYRIFLWLIWMFLLGFPGFQYSRIKDERLGGYRLLRGLLRYFQDGVIAEFFYSIAVFIALEAINRFLMPEEWTHLYYELHVSTVSEEFYVFVGIIGFQITNALWFTWHILGNFLCPYDYKAELKLRLETRTRK